MPLIDRKSPITSANARASDVASRMVEQIVPLQQQKMMSAFRVQGIQGILYSHLTQGIRCVCHSKNSTVSQLSPDGKASPGAINRVLTGSSRFGVSNYDDTPEAEFDAFDDEPTSPNNQFSQWLGDLNTAGNQPSDEPSVNDDGQSSPDLDDLLAGFDMGSIGLSDVSCPICFGSSYVGGYSMFRGFRKVLLPHDFSTASTYDLPSFELSPGVHVTTVTLPRGASQLDVFRAMLNNKPVPASFSIDGDSMAHKNLLRYCDGLPHTLTLSTQSPITHVEIQFALSDEPVYFEIPKLTRNSDIQLLEQQEPFQILVSPDVPTLKTLDIIAESQLGKMLIVQTVNPWNTRNRQMLGHEVMVRVAQPQELYNILPFRSRITGQKTAHNIAPAKSKVVSGVNPVKGFVF